MRPLDQGEMRAVHQWVLAHGDHLLFLYGQYDPWSAQPFVLGPGTRDSALAFSRASGVPIISSTWAASGCR